MAFIPIANCWEVRVQQVLVSAQPQVNVYHVDGTAGTPLTQGTANSIAEKIEDTYETSGLISLLSTSWSLDKITITDLTSASAPQFDGVFDARIGVDAAELLPPFTAGSIEWITGLRGRSYRGRTYHGGFCEDSSQTGPTAAFQTVFQAFATALQTGLAGISVPMVVASRYSGTHLVAGSGGQLIRRPLPRGAGIMTPITSSHIETVWNTQRRRNTVG